MLVLKLSGKTVIEHLIYKMDGVAYNKISITMIVLFQIPELLSRAAPFVIPILFPAPEILILFKGLCVDLNK